MLVYTLRILNVEWCGGKSVLGKEDDDTADSEIEGSIGEHVRQMVAELLLSGLDAPAPNVSHILLGMHEAVVTYNDYAKRGNLDIAERCANELSSDFGWNEDSCYLAIVDRVLRDYLTDRRRSRLASLCYRIVHRLASQPATAPFVS